MPTQSQIDANRLNAQKSTGPRTETGKSRSRWNALKSGLDAKSIIIPCESPDDFAELQANLQAEYQPATPSEQILVDMLVASAWKCFRFHRADRQRYTAQLLIAVNLSNHDPNLPMAEYPPSGDTDMRLQRRINDETRTYRLIRADLLRRKPALQAQPEAEPEPVPEPAPDAPTAQPLEAAPPPDCRNEPNLPAPKPPAIEPTPPPNERRAA